MKESTKKIIGRTFNQLLETKPIDKITVKEIVTLCNINRQTFYYHFYDIYDLMKWCMLEDSKTFNENLPRNCSQSNKLIALYEFLVSKRKLFLHAYNTVNRQVYRRFIKQQINVFLVEKLNSSPAGSKLKEDRKSFIIKTFCNILTNHILDWIEAGMPDASESTILDYLTLFEIAFNGAIEEYSKR